MKRLFFGIVALWVTTPATSETVTWEKQAERLQNVNAALLDNVPAGEPIRSGSLGVEAKAVISFLPEVDPTVGNKTEDVPSAPAHLVPTVQINHAILPYLGYQAWVGYLIPGAEGLLGVDASLSQLSFGFAAVPSYSLGNFELQFQLGFQQSQAEVTGSITEEDSDDKFTATTTVIYFAPGARYKPMNLWASLLVGGKTTESKFEIEVDQTNLEFTDKPPVYQLAAGWQGENFQVAIAELIVPNRLMMPRILVGYQYNL